MTDRTDDTRTAQAWRGPLTTRGGLVLHVRPIEESDRALLERFFAGLQADDLRFRFLTPVARPCASLLEALVNVDHVRTEDYLSFLDGADGRELVASAMLAADPDGERAEVAIAVRPDLKGRGIGWSMLDFVAGEARARGIRRLEAIELRDNRAAIEVERDMGFVASEYPDDPALTLLSKQLLP